MPLHVIRLRGPWEYELISAQSCGIRQSGTVQIQSAWPPELANARGESIRLRRRFHRPTGLEPRDRVWLCVSGLEDIDEVQLNGMVLRPSGESERDEQRARRSLWRWEITDCLEASNAVVIGVNSAFVARDRPSAEVTLEIESPEVGHAGRGAVIEAQEEGAAQSTPR